MGTGAGRRCLAWGSSAARVEPQRTQRGPVPDPGWRELLRARTGSKHRSGYHMNSRYPMHPTRGGSPPIRP
ncbi:hypothetical protein NDU88_005189 [Pleurodeles waltl]|uniref:Uncharacterized protein n=1 Tax=Pleurodeles waltl TaxID=8319 RepID=A0AAV7PJP3_PLEWA|nr:hypothetical protein NDU88_005189 [Pleurodeles waltl]